VADKRTRVSENKSKLDKLKAVIDKLKEKKSNLKKTTPSKESPAWNKLENSTLGGIHKGEAMKLKETIRQKKSEKEMYDNKIEAAIKRHKKEKAKQKGKTVLMSDPPQYK